MKIDSNCIGILKKLESSGFQAFFVGGCVRDTLMNQEINDVDVTTDALP
ncbi:MAG: CCA tRNA nucleotidyltransferase, partial [Oscillospiraceae bacterium]|nr:CCA tRNA nucleotidyltransferase [Oscillospiraceae bacterium]